MCGSAGCGKTLLVLEFLAHGVLQYGEPGVCMEFEEATEKLTTNVRSLGLDLRALAKSKKLLVDHVRVERNEVEESGEYNLDGLFIRLVHAVDSIKAFRGEPVLWESLSADWPFDGRASRLARRSELARLSDICYTWRSIQRLKISQSISNRMDCTPAICSLR